MSTHIIWDTSSEKVSWNICKMCRFRSSCIWAKYHPGFSRCSYSLQYPVILLVDSEGSNQTALDVQADLGLYCPHLPEDTFSHGISQYAFVKK